MQFFPVPLNWKINHNLSKKHFLFWAMGCICGCPSENSEDFIFLFCFWSSLDYPGSHWSFHFHQLLKVSQMEGQQCLHKLTRDINVNGISHLIRNTLIGNFCFLSPQPCTPLGSLTLFPRKEHCHQLHSNSPGNWMLTTPMSLMTPLCTKWTKNTEYNSD